MKHLDMMGRPCPIPVVEARKALRAGEDAVRVDVDNGTAVQNLKKMADGDGYAFTSMRIDEAHWRITLVSGAGNGNGAAGASGAAVSCEAAPEMMTHKNQTSVLLIGREHMGEGDPKLGTMLMKGFLFAQSELAQPPTDVIFLNGGAKLTVEGAATVQDLKALEAKGARIWVCGTCANFFGIGDKLGVGSITDMMNIARMLSEAGRVTTL